MMAWEHIHWFITSRCNMECSYCFKPIESSTEGMRSLERIARILVKRKVKQVILGGGEPTLVAGLDKALKILKKGGIYVSLHTNGIRLTKDRIKQFSGLVDDIGLPIDSLDEAVQKRLRGKRFMPFFKRLFKVAETIRDNGIQLGYHTVFTAVNTKEIPTLYEKINQTDFSYWRIYEFNEDLAFSRILTEAKSVSDYRARRKVEQKYKEIDFLRGIGTKEKGYTDCMFAYFLLAEKQMREEHEDKRVEFVGLRDSNRPMYVFLKNQGDVFFYHWFSGRKRQWIGNIMRSFPFTMRQLKKAVEKGPLLDKRTEEDFVDAMNSLPIWARLYEGNHFPEELYEIDKTFMPQVEMLQELYIDRIKRLEQSNCQP